MLPKDDNMNPPVEKNPDEKAPKEKDDKAAKDGADAVGKDLGDDTLPYCDELEGARRLTEVRKLSRKCLSLIPNVTGRTRNGSGQLT